MQSAKVAYDCFLFWVRMNVVPLIVRCDSNGCSPVLVGRAGSGTWTAECRIEIGGECAKFECERTIQHFRREQICRLVDIDRSRHEEIARQWNPLRVPYAGPLAIAQLKLRQDGFSGLNTREKVREIALNMGQIHLI